MNGKQILSSLMVTMMTLSANAQGRFDEMVYAKTQTTFRLNAPSMPKVRIYQNGLGGKAVKTVKMRAIGTNRWEATIKGDLNGKFYTFDIGRGECPGTIQRGHSLQVSLARKRVSSSESWAV